MHAAVRTPGNYAATEHTLQVRQTVWRNSRLQPHARQVKVMTSQVVPRGQPIGQFRQDCPLERDADAHNGAAATEEFWGYQQVHMSNQQSLCRHKWVMRCIVGCDQMHETHITGRIGRLNTAADKHIIGTAGGRQ
jgi:hypothetical protein